MSSESSDSFHPNLEDDGDYSISNSPEYHDTFNTELKKIPINKDDAVAEQDLNHESNKGLLEYLVVCFILAQDAVSLNSLLKDITILIHYTINMNEIRDFEKSIRFGILEKESFKDCLDKYMSRNYLKGSFQCKLQDRRYSNDFGDLIEDEHIYGERENHINLLLLACLTDDLEIIKIMTDNMWDVNEEDFHSILLHEHVNEQVVEYLINRGTWTAFS